MTSKKLTLEIIRQLPKADLHCHLDGFARPETVLELAREQNVTLPGVPQPVNLETLRSMMQCPVDCHDLPTYLKCFDITLSVMQYAYAITRILYEACEDAVRDGISYLELRFAPALHTQRGLTYSQILQAAIDGCVMAEANLPITVRIICCAMRQMSPDVNAQIAEICWRYRHRYVVGFDLAGPEFGFPSHKHISAFRKMRKKRVSVTIHAGEAYGAESIDSALQCSAQRIGHGTRIMEDPGVLQEVIDRRVPLEICVTSNVQTQAAKDFESHPIKKLFDLGVRTVPCTDNPTVSMVTLSGEYLLLHEKFGFSVAEMLRMIDYGFRAAFIPEAGKKRLRLEAFVRAMKVLRENGIDISEIERAADYYGNIGMSVPPKFRPPVKNPPITLELLKQMPKCDIDCRLAGSMPYELMWELYSGLTDEEKKALKYDFKNLEDIKSFCMNESVETYHNKGKLFAARLLQTEENIRKSVSAVLDNAWKDKVVYMELTVSPFQHLSKGLTPEKVIDTVLDEVGKFCQGKDMIVKVVLSVNIKSSNVLQVQQGAELAVRYKGKGVVGFMTTTQEIGVDEMRYYEETFEYLRKNHVAVTMFAGESDVESVQSALICGYARRISGGFLVPQSDSLLTELAAHNIAMLTSLSPRFVKAVSSITKSPARFFFDFGVKLAFCSINISFTNMTRSELLMQMAKESGFDIMNILKVMSNTFASVFVENAVSKDLQYKFWEESVAVLKSNGFTNLMNYEYFVE